LILKAIYGQNLVNIFKKLTYFQAIRTLRKHSHGAIERKNHNKAHLKLSRKMLNPIVPDLGFGYTVA
jgi:hypothetical protein